MVCCEICNCPLTLLFNAQGHKERRTLCSRCMEEESAQFQVGVFEEISKDATDEDGEPKAKVLRLDKYLAERVMKKVRRGRVLM